MKYSLSWPKQFALTQSGKMCFGVAAGAFLTAALGIIINQFLVGWLATGAMIAIGLLYVAMGLTQIRIVRPKVRARFADKCSYKEPRHCDDAEVDSRNKTWKFPSDFQSEGEELRSTLSNMRNHG